MTDALVSALQERHPKVWAMISDASGDHYILRSLHKYLKLSLGAEADDDLTALRIVLEKLDQRGSSASRGRWRILRSALLPASGNSQTVEAASVRSTPELNLMEKRSCGVLHGWNPSTLVAVVHDTDRLDDVLVPVADVLAGNGAQPPSCCLVWTCVSARVVENWLASRLDRSIEVNPCFGATISPRQAGGCRRSHALVEFRTCDCPIEPGCRPFVLTEFSTSEPSFLCGAEARDVVEASRSVFTVQPQPAAPSLDALVAHRSGTGVDNTGNVCVWPCEEVMAYLCSWNPAFSVAGKRVLELGGGSTGLAGLFCSAAGGATEVVITDGNEQAAQNASLCVAFNAAMTVFPPGCQISVGCFPWAPVDPSSPMYQHFDALLCADCLFFEEFHEQLLSVCATCLKVDADAKAWLVAPSRGGSLERFVAKAREFKHAMGAGTAIQLGVEVLEDFDSHVSRRFGGDGGVAADVSDRHKPLLVVLSPSLVSLEG